MVNAVSLYGLPTAMRMTDERAVGWLLRNGFDPRADLAHLAPQHVFTPGPPPPPAAPPKPATPEWNRETGELRFNDAVAKKVRIAVAGNSVKVLDAFQEEGWPSRIDDPLDPSKDQQRLHETIKRLNDNLETIRFRAIWNGARDSLGADRPGTAPARK